jgi:uncharacterized protein
MKKYLIFLLCLFFLLIFSYLSFFKPDKSELFPLFLIGTIAAFLGTLAGGGALITVPSMMLIGIPIQSSIATNKFSSGIAAISSVFYLLRHKQLNVKSILSLLAVACIGGISGACLTVQIDERSMNILAFVLLCVALFVTMKSQHWTRSALKQDPDKKTVSYLPFLIALYDGGFGPGSSTFSILYYLKSCQNYMAAVQMTRVLILGSCSGAFLIYVQTGFIHWPYAIVLAAGSTLGSQVGLMMLPKIPAKTAKRLLLLIILLLIAQMLNKLV